MVIDLSTRTSLVRRYANGRGWTRGISLLFLLTVLVGCGGGSSDDTPSAAAPPPAQDSPQDDPLFQLSFPPSMSRTEATSIAIVGQLRDGVEASTIIARIGDQETALSSNPNGEWRGELPLTEGVNAIAITVTPTTGDEQTLDLATINSGLLLGFPNDLVVIDNQSYTLDRDRLAILGLVEIDLTTDAGRRVALNPSIAPPQQPLGQVNGELFVRADAGNFSLLDLSSGTSRAVFPFPELREVQQRPTNVVLDDSINRVYATLNSEVLFADIGDALPVSFSQGISFEPVNAGSLLGLDTFNKDLLFQAFTASAQSSPPLVTINVESGARTDRALSFREVPITAVAALAEPNGLVLADPLGQFFRLEGESLMSVSPLLSPNEQASVAALATFDEQWLALDSTRGNLFTVNPQTGSRESVLSSANGLGPPSPGWHGLIFDSSNDELLGISFIGAQRIDARSGDRSDAIAIDFEAISAGPNFIALPPLADGLSINADGSAVLFARVTNVAMGPTDIVRLNLATGVSETLATINSQATGTLLPRFPSVVTDASRQLAWFFDVNAERSLNRIDLTTGTITDLVLSVSDRPLLAVLADPVNNRLLYATLETNAGENRLDIIALNDDGQMPEILASLVVDTDTTSVIDPRIQMALSAAGDVLYVPLPTTERVAVINLTNGEGSTVGNSVATDLGRQFVRFSTGLSAAIAPDGRLFLVNGDSGIQAIDPASGSQVLLSR